MDRFLESKRFYRPEIDGLRALAVIFVIIYHFNQNVLPAGFLGVDIFFVISGYVISSSFARKESKNISVFLINFYARRIKRLLPALLVFVTTFCLLLSILVPQPGSSLKTAISSLFGLSNIYLFNYSTDYFAQENELNVFLHTWSLGVEAQFYLFFPLIIWFSGFNKKHRNGYRNFFFSVLFLSIFSIISFINSYEVNTSAAYFLTHNRFWEIGLGSITFLLVNHNSKSIKEIQKIPNILILLIMISLTTFKFPAVALNNFLIVFLTALLLIGLKKHDNVYKFLVNERVVHIGSISYSLYLWHWGVISLSRWTIGIHWWSIPIQLISIYYCSNLSYKFLEKNSSNQNFFKNSLIKFIFGILALISSSFFIYLLGKPLKGVFYIGNKSNINNFSEKEYWNFKYCKPDKLDSEKQFSEKYKKCWISLNGYQKNTEYKNIFIYGNSYNAMLMPIPGELVKSGEETNFHSFYRVGCLPSSKVKYEKDGVLGSCAKNFNSYINFFKKKSKKGDSLLLIDSYTLFMKSSAKELYAENKLVSPIKARKIFINELKELSQELKSKGKTLLITSPIPAIKYNPLICGSSLARTNNKCRIKSNRDILDFTFNNEMSNINLEMKELENYEIIYLDIYEQLLKEINNDLNNIYSYYSDKEHLTKKGALSLMPYFINKILR